MARALAYRLVVVAFRELTAKQLGFNTICGDEITGDSKICACLYKNLVSIDELNDKIAKDRIPMKSRYQLSPERDA
jgi:hypothetical protein